jgi:hypothetical protein
MHWDGSAWSVIPSPNAGPAAFSSQLTAVTAVASNDVWAVGFTTDTLVEHWDGNHWGIVPSQSGGGLWGVAAVNARDLWAVGAGNGQPLVERYYCPGPP